MILTKYRSYVYGMEWTETVIGLHNSVHMTDSTVACNIRRTDRKQHEESKSV